MYCLSVLYPNGLDTHFDLKYYRETHMRLVQERLGPGGMKRFELAKGTAGWPPDNSAPYAMICNMYFDSLSDLERAFGAHSNELIADIRAYTNIRPTMVISEIVD